MTKFHHRSKPVVHPRNPATGRPDAQTSDGAPPRTFSRIENTPEALLPPGYRIVENDMHMISARDMVFLGGSRSFWESARRAGESGGLRRFSVARAVASPIPA